MPATTTPTTTTRQSWYPLAGIPAHDLLSLIDANETQIEGAGINLLSYIAPGDAHTVLSDGTFYTETVNGVKLVDWVTRLINGENVDDVHCSDCTARSSRVATSTTAAIVRHAQCDVLGDQAGKRASGDGHEVERRDQLVAASLTGERFGDRDHPASHADVHAAVVRASRGTIRRRPGSR